MKKIIYFSAIATLMSSTLSMTSCSDFLEAENKSAGGQTADEYFSSNPSALLISAYSNLKKIADQNQIYDNGTDLYIDTRGVTASAFSQYTVDADNSTVQSLYVNCFGAINYANGVLEYASSTSTEAYEARFIRNYAYYVLTQNFGGVPYVTSYIQNANRAYPRAELKNEYADIISDLEDLYNNSSLAETDHTSGHPSKQAVAALIAKFYLAAGWDIDTEITNEQKGTYSVNSTSNFSKAYDWAVKAINGQQLTMSFEDKWLTKNEGNDETIWSIKYQTDGISGELSSEGNSQQGSYGGYYSTGYKGCDSRNQQSVKSMYLFEPEDLRYEATFMTTFYQGEDLASGYMSYYNKTAAALATSSIGLKFFPYYVTETEAKAWLDEHKTQLVKGSNPNSVKAVILTSPSVSIFSINADGSYGEPSTKTLDDFNKATDNGVCVKKFDDAVTINYCYRDIVVLHVSELYLVAAEAALMSNDSQNYWKYINAVRARAGLTTALSKISDYQPSYNLASGFGDITELDLLLDERARETYAEKTRYVDLRRTKQLVRYNLAFCEYVSSVETMTGIDGKIKWLRPIPNGEIENNTAISKADQNPGYVETTADNVE